GRLARLAGGLGGGLAGSGLLLRRGLLRRLAGPGGRLAGRRLAAEAAQFGGQGVHAGAQALEVFLARHAEAVEGTLDALLEHLFQAIPGVDGALAHHADTVLDDIAHRINAAGGQLAGGLLEAHAFLDQGLEQLGTLALGALEGADAGGPDLLRGTHDRARQLLGAGLEVGGTGLLRGGLGAGGLLELGHGAGDSSGRYPSGSARCGARCLRRLELSHQGGGRIQPRRAAGRCLRTRTSTSSRARSSLAVVAVRRRAGPRLASSEASGSSSTSARRRRPCCASSGSISARRRRRSLRVERKACSQTRCRAE